MTVKRSMYSLLSLILALMLVVSALPGMAVTASETEFVSVNILRQEGAIDTEASKGSVYFSLRSPASSFVESTRLTSKNLLTKLTDGLLSYDAGQEPDILANSNTDFRLFGALFALKQTYYSDHITVYGGAKTLVDYYRVYASDSLDTLYRNENLTIVEGNGSSAGVEVPLHKDVRYIAFVYDHLKTYQDTGREDASNGRPKEIELWSGDESQRFDSENLLISEKLVEAKSIAVKSADGSVVDYSANNGKVPNVVNGQDTYTHTDVYSYNDGNVGFQFKFDSLYYIGEVVIDAGTYWSESTNYNEKYSVYAADTLEDLYKDSALVAANVSCKNAAGARVAVNRYARYVAVVNTEHNGIRIRQILVKTASDAGVEKPFVSENVLQTQLEKAEAFSYYSSNGNIVYEAVIPDDKLAQMTDGNTTNHFDLMALSAPRFVGAQFTLKQSCYIGQISLYAGYVTYPETYSVYASDSLETLYTASSRVAESATATEVSTVVAAVNRSVRYIAFICDSYNGCPRFKEIEAWTAEAKDVFVPENVLQTHLSDAKGVDMFKSNGTVVDSTNFNLKTDAITAMTDGNTAAPVDLGGGGAPTWNDNPRYVGALFTLDDAYFAGSVSVFAGISGYPESWRVYAADSLDTLYNDANIILQTENQTGAEATAAVNKYVRYIAFFCTADSGNARPHEFQLWTGNPADKPEPGVPDSLKVLTIGNSFSENTSVYASEIARNNGKNLTFGYLKFPSCTIEMHYTAAVENRAVFKFDVVFPDGSHDTAAQRAAASSFDDTKANGATVDYALSYCDWDVIVFQQESNSSRYASTFEKLGDLVAYVKDKAPNARLAIHEVWRWGKWSPDEFTLIQNNTRAAAAQYQLEYIPTGTAFENARTALGSDIIVNDYDGGNYQHANTYGQYIAGSCYVAALFGTPVSEDTLTDHPYVNDNGQVAVLTRAANDAVAARPVYGQAGDMNGDGYLDDSDVAALQQGLLGLVAYETVVADANGDGTVDIRDLVFLSEAVA